MSDTHARYVVEPIDGFASTHRSVEGAARALLRCEGRCAPVCVEIGHGAHGRRNLTPVELRRLGAAVRQERERRHGHHDGGESDEVAA